MVRLAALSYHLPQGFLYKEISLFIDRGDKIGLTGKNGVGKSTLLGLISKQLTPTEGSVIHEKGISVGYLTQDIEIPKDINVREYIERSNKEVTHLQDRLDHVNNELLTREDYESDEYTALIEEVTELNDRLTILDAHAIAEKIELVLKGLGFKQGEIDKKIGEFSGGWQMRVELAKLLVNNPDVLLIDEPTNHLDIVSIQWLENYLQNFKGGLIVISHDKRFLDNVTNRTVEIANQRLYDYKCNYSKYLVLHEEELERTFAAKKNQEKEIKRYEELISKYRAKANKAAFAQSLIKKLDKMERIEIDTIQRAGFNVKFTLDNPSGKRVLDIQGLSKKYGDKQIFKNLDVLLSRGEKIALLGPNGVGKSTLIKSINSEIEFEGKIEKGHNVSIGYFAQDSAETLDQEMTVFETVDIIAKGEKRKDIRSILGAFLFSGEDVDKQVKVLSGGERTRLAICRLLFADFNLLIMDEPTNHLDIQSKEILKDALKNYEGTLLLVSHDRDFLDGLSNKIWEIHPTEVKLHYFGVNEFIKRFEDQDITEQRAEKPQKVVQQIEQAVKKEDYFGDKKRKSQINKLENQIKKSEQKIEKFETEIAAKSAELESIDYQDNSDYQDMLTAFEQVQKKLEEEMLSWEDANKELEQLKSF